MKTQADHLMRQRPKKSNRWNYIVKVFFFCTAKYSKFLAPFINSVDRRVTIFWFVWYFVGFVSYIDLVRRQCIPYSYSLCVCRSCKPHVLLPLFFVLIFAFAIVYFLRFFSLIHFVEYVVRKGLKWQDKISKREHLLIIQSNSDTVYSTVQIVLLCWGNEFFIVCTVNEIWYTYTKALFIRHSDENVR